MDREKCYWCRSKFGIKEAKERVDVYINGNPISTAIHSICLDKYVGSVYFKKDNQIIDFSLYCTMFPGL
jgi:hypothetical protein